MSDTLWLVEITDYDGGEVVRRYATEGYVTKPLDTPASTHYAPHVQIPANYSRRVRGEGGRADVGGGEVVLANPDGALDGLFDAVDGRSLRVLTVAPGAAYSTATLVLKATMEQAEYTWQRVRIRLRDRVAELADKQVQTTKYAGTTTSGTVKDAEGRPEDIKGQPKPLVFGKAYSVPAVPADVFNKVYQVHDGAVSAISSVTTYDQGVLLTNAGDVATLADVYAATIASGEYKTCLAEGYFRLGGSSSGIVTADVVQGATAGDRTAAQIMLQLAELGRITDVDTAAFTALDTTNSAELGLWIAGERDIASVMDEVAQSVGAWWGFDRTGNLTCGRLEAPPGSPAATYTTVEILDRGQRLERIAGEIPAYRVVLKYRRNWQPLDGSEVAGSVTDEDRAALAQEYRTVVATDATVQTTHLLAREIERETLLVDATAAQTEADRLLALYKVRRDRYRVPVTASYATGRDLGDEVQIKVPRFGLTAGGNAIVLGITENAEKKVTDLEVRA
jgi:hypothetical protein